MRFEASFCIGHSSVGAQVTLDLAGENPRFEFGSNRAEVLTQNWVYPGTGSKPVYEDEQVVE